MAAPRYPSDFPVVNDQTLPTIIESEVARAIGHMDGTLSEARTKEFQYYYAHPFGNEVEGESQVVSTDVADTIEGILPIILKIFTGSDDVVRFDPNGPEDEEQAQQQTETANYVFYRQNNGFLVLYEWFKDALIQKNGIVKYWWDEKQTRTEESYQGLTEGQYQDLLNDANALQVEKLEETVYDDPAAIEARGVMAEEIKTKVPPEQQPQALAMMEAIPIPQLYDCKLRITKDISQIRIQAVPPEEFGISASQNTVSIQDTNFCYHRTRKTISTLREMGCPEDIIDQLAPANEPDITPEAIARDRYYEDTNRNDQGPMPIESWVWVTECFIRVDYDNDGIAELRHIIMPGRTVWINEETDHINFAALTPIIMPHRWIGRSVAELVMDIQFQKSVLWRQMFNNLYLTNNPQKAVLSSAGGIVQANLDDLLTTRPGGILREYQPNAIRNIETPFVAGSSFPMLEYLDGVKENRTGVTRYNQGTDADSLNKTARGVSLIMSAGQERTNLIARIFAETGVKDLMRGIVYMLSKHQGRKLTLKLRNKWVDVDPREWKTQFNMTVNVGLGTGSRDTQIAQLGLIHQQQIELMKTGRGYMVSDENIWNLYRKMSELAGYKHPELFVTDPQKVPPEAKQPRPDPAMLKVQTDAQEGAAKLQAGAQKDQLQAQTEITTAQIEAASREAVAQINAAASIQIATMNANAQAQLAVFDKTTNLKDEKHQLELAKKDIQVAGQALDVKKNLEDRVIEHREQAALSLANQNEQRIVEREQSIVAQMNEQMAQAIGGVQQALSQLSPMLQALLQAQQQALQMQQGMAQMISAPQEISLGDVQTDADGRITGASVTKRPSGRVN